MYSERSQRTQLVSSQSIKVVVLPDRLVHPVSVCDQRYIFPIVLPSGNTYELGQLLAEIVVALKMGDDKKTPFPQQIRLQEGKFGKQITFDPFRATPNPDFLALSRFANQMNPPIDSLLYQKSIWVGVEQNTANRVLTHIFSHLDDNVCAEYAKLDCEITETYFKTQFFERLTMFNQIRATSNLNPLTKTICERIDLFHSEIPSDELTHDIMLAFSDANKQKDYSSIRKLLPFLPAAYQHSFLDCVESNVFCDFFSDTFTDWDNSPTPIELPFPLLDDDRRISGCYLGIPGDFFIQDPLASSTHVLRKKPATFIEFGHMEKADWVEILCYLTAHTNGRYILKNLLCKSPDIFRGIGKEAWAVSREGVRGHSTGHTPFHWLIGTKTGREIITLWKARYPKHYQETIDFHTRQHHYYHPAQIHIRRLQACSQIFLTLRDDFIQIHSERIKNGVDSPACILTKLLECMKENGPDYSIITLANSDKIVEHICSTHNQAGEADLVNTLLWMRVDSLKTDDFRETHDICRYFYDKAVAACNLSIMRVLTRILEQTSYAGTKDLVATGNLWKDAQYANPAYAATRMQSKMMRLNIELFEKKLWPDHVIKRSVFLHACITTPGIDDVDKLILVSSYLDLCSTITKINQNKQTLLNDPRVAKLYISCLIRACEICPLVNRQKIQSSLISFIYFLYEKNLLRSEVFRAIDYLIDSGANLDPSTKLGMAFEYLVSEFKADFRKTQSAMYLIDMSIHIYEHSTRRIHDLITLLSQYIDRADAILRGRQREYRINGPYVTVELTDVEGNRFPFHPKNIRRCLEAESLADNIRQTLHRKKILPDEYRTIGTLVYILNDTDLVALLRRSENSPWIGPICQYLISKHPMVPQSRPEFVQELITRGILTCKRKLSTPATNPQTRRRIQDSAAAAPAATPAAAPVAEAHPMGSGTSP